MKLSIVISTYYRKDGSTSHYLTKALDSIFNQTHQDFIIYLIGDRYENEKEINEIVSKYDKTKILFTNLEIAKERDLYTDKWVIWSYGGVNAVNYGIDQSIKDGNYIICHLDHDDWWYPNHLEEINKCIELTGADWVCTKSTYANPSKFLPNILTTDLYTPFHPRSSSLIHSSVCMNFKTIPLRYRNIFEETQKLGAPADADLWERARGLIIKNNLKSYYINMLTCRHDEEGYERK
jgi:glycosyltransferase involved in cell wall biosynthesis